MTDWWSRLRRIRVAVGVVVMGLGLVAWLAPAAGAFAFRPAAGSPYAVGNPAISAAVGDFNGDGSPDIAVISAAPLLLPSFASVLLADGSRGFRPATSQPRVYGGGSMAVADFNGDGKLDLVATTRTGVDVLLGNGDGTFTPAPGSPIELGSSPYSPIQAVVGDFNGDGRPDLGVLLSDDTTAVLLGNGDGTFSPAPGSPIALGNGTPGAIAVGDLTGDGRLDLAITDLTHGSVSILLGNGDGTFSPVPGSPIAVGGMPSDLAVADLNGDGKPDLAVDDAPVGALTVLLGRGDGAFTPAPGSPVVLSDQRVAGLAVADFNDDGKPDVALGSGTGLNLLLGDGSGGFTPAHGSPFPDQGWPLASGRFDGRAGMIVTDGNGVALLLAPVPSDPPTAALTVRPKRVTAGQKITLDASGSSDPLDRKIVDYRWSLGGGRFNHDTGTNPKLTTTLRNPGTLRVRVRITNAAGETAIATANLSVRAPSRSAVIAGYVRVCGGPAPGRCSKRAVHICTPARGCVTSDRVAAVNARRRVVAVRKLKNGRFRMRLAPGSYTIELLGDGNHVHRRVLQHRKVNARAHHTAVVLFVFAFP